MTGPRASRLASYGWSSCHAGRGVVPSDLHLTCNVDKNNFMQQLCALCEFADQRKIFLHAEENVHHLSIYSRYNSYRFSTQYSGIKTKNPTIVMTIFILIRLLLSILRLRKIRGKQQWTSFARPCMCIMYHAKNYLCSSTRSQNTRIPEANHLYQNF